MSVSRLRLCVMLAAICAAVVSTQSMQAQPTQPATTAPVIAIDTTTPRGSLKSLLQARRNGDGKMIKQVIATTNPVEDKMVDNMIVLSEAEHHFRSSIEKQFGDKATEMTGSIDKLYNGTMANIDAAKEVIDGASAVLLHGGPNGSDLKLTKSGDIWQVPMSELSLGRDPAEVSKEFEGYAQLAVPMNETADEVVQGKYAAVKDAEDAIEQKIIISMMKRAATSAPATTEPVK